MAVTDTLTAGTAILSLSVKSAMDRTLGLRVLRNIDSASHADTPRTWPCVLSQRISNPGTPLRVKCTLPERSASFSAAAPANVCHCTLRSGMPPAAACFSMSLYFSMMIAGSWPRLYERPMLMDVTSAHATTGTTSPASASTTQRSANSAEENFTGRPPEKICLVFDPKRPWMSARACALHDDAPRRSVRCVRELELQWRCRRHRAALAAR